METLQQKNALERARVRKEYKENLKLLQYYFNYTDDDYVYTIYSKVINKVNNLPEGIVKAFNAIYGGHNKGYILDNKMYMAKEDYENLKDHCNKDNIILNQENVVIIK